MVPPICPILLWYPCSFLLSPSRVNSWGLCVSSCPYLSPVGVCVLVLVRISLQFLWKRAERNRYKLFMWICANQGLQKKVSAKGKCRWKTFKKGVVSQDFRLFFSKNSLGNLFKRLKQFFDFYILFLQCYFTANLTFFMRKKSFSCYSL